MKKKSWSIDEVLDKLHALANPDKVNFKAQKFAVIANNSLGIYQKDLKALAKEIGKNSELGAALFETGIYEARLLCSKLFRSKDLTEELMEQWVKTFENWEICDSFSMRLFAESTFAVPKIKEWSEREPEFEKRAAFAMIAGFCMANKDADNEVFRQFFPLLLREAKDDRIYVKKAVNWALRNIGKRNVDLHQEAIAIAEQMLELQDKTANWIAKDALREFRKEKLRMSDYPRSIYRK